MLRGLPGCRLLVVDDSATNRAVVGARLHRAGFQHVSFAGDGRQALEMIEADAPDLVLLDLLMPVLDGFETCRLLRANPHWAELPVLAMTGLEKVDERARIFTAGATDLILKPINQAELAARVTSHLKNRLLIRSLRDINERVRTELAAARHMQQTLLPDAARLAAIQDRYGVSLAARFMPSTELAGDLWDVWPIDANRFGLVAMDVAGHGTVAAINAFRIHTLLRQRRAEHTQPGPFLEGLNRRLCPLLSPGQFATMFYAVLDVAADEVQYAAAGYTSPVLGNARTNQMLDGSGLPLGITTAARYETARAAWGRGDSLLLYSDAVTEARDATGAMRGEDGTHRLCAEALREADAARVMAKLDTAITRAAGLDDDLTLICVMR